MKQILPIITSLFVFTSSDAQENKTNTINSDKEESLTMEAKHIETVVSFFTAVAAADADAAGSYLHPDYIQHNPFIPTGRDGFLGLLPILKLNNTTAENKDYYLLFNIAIQKDIVPEFRESAMVVDYVRVYQ